MKDDLGGLAAVPEQSEAVITQISEEQPEETLQSAASLKPMPGGQLMSVPPFCPLALNGPVPSVNSGLH